MVHVHFAQKKVEVKKSPNIYITLLAFLEFGFKMFDILNVSQGSSYNEKTILVLNINTKYNCNIRNLINNLYF